MSDPAGAKPRGDSTLSREGLRRRAEARIDQMLDQDVPLDPEEVRRLVHELSVHEIELEMQNEQLRQTQIALETAKARYYDLYHEAPIAFLTIGSEGRILDCNAEAARLLGLPEEALQRRRRLFDFLGPAQIQELEDLRTHMTESGQSQTLVTTMQKGNGRSMWVELTMKPAQDIQSGSAVTRIALTDITLRRMMEEHSAHLAAIITSSDLAIISEDLSGRITTWNAAAEVLFGYSPAEMVGQRLMLLADAERQHEDLVTRRAASRGETIAHEVVRVRQDGSRIPVFETVSPIRDVIGRVSGVSRIARDISEQVASRERQGKLLDELTRSETALREADQRKDQFLAVLAHELRNPLAPIRNAAAVLRYARGLDPKVEWCRDVIDRQVGLMATLLEDLLDVSRITRNTITVHRGRVELSAAVSQALEISQPLIMALGHRLTIELPDEPLEVAGDLTRLAQVFGNLLNNAAKYTDPGGNILVRAEPRDERAVILIKDSGIGIDPDHLPRIFDLFTQVDSSTRRTHSGLGIGLSLVKGLVELHGGTITARSEGLGKGSEFEVSLPLVSSAETGFPHFEYGLQTGSGSFHEAPRQVLVVDDNSDEVDSLAMLLRLHGHEVRTANDGEEALQAGRIFEPEVVMLDLGMPRMDGYDTARRIRSEPWGRETVLVAVTGWGRAEDRERSTAAGFDYHFAKPVSLENLLKVVSQARHPLDRSP
jgi:two-component system, chemotaxis family, CheB/CheR fusion protein